MLIGYARVSSTSQNLDRQLVSLKEAGAERIFEEKISGKSMNNREELQNMLSFIREGDVVIIHDFSRLARNLKDLLEIADIISEKGGSLRSLKESVDTGSDLGRLVLGILGSVYAFEREAINTRQAEGIRLAKERGVYQGGQRKKIDETVFTALLEKYQGREINKKQFAESLRVSRPTLDKLLKEREAC